MLAVRPQRKPARSSRIRSLTLTTCCVVAFAFCSETAAADPTNPHANATPSLEAGDALGRAIFGSRARRAPAFPGQSADTAGSSPPRAAPARVNPTEWLVSWHERRAAEATPHASPARLGGPRSEAKPSVVRAGELRSPITR